MNTNLKIILLASIATAIAPIASAQTSSLEARLQAMEAQISQLRIELAAEKAQTDNDLILLERKAETIIAPVASTQKGAGLK